MKRGKKITLILMVLIILIIVVFLTKTGFYSIQQIGAIPEGATWLVWRASGEPFFNSADATSLRKTGSVSLMSRGLALAEAPKDRIILRLPYWKFAYMRSTGGNTFDR